jgi:antitoxin component YwqK of YwqJK toxin-antitoxin module
MELRSLPILASFLLALAAPGADADVSCPPGSARVTGAPAREIFDPDLPEAGHANWCERYDAHGRATREGPYIDHYRDGAPRSRGRFVAGRLEGEVLILHPNGRLWLAARYRAGRLNGRYALYSPAGHPWLTAQYRAGQSVGTHTLYYYDSGRKAAETHYESGLEEGLARSWHANGRVSREIEIHAGRWRGHFASWYPSGAIRSEGQYVACPKGAASPSCADLGAARHGTWMSYHENGGRRARGRFQYGEKVGTWVHWQEDGTPAGLDSFDARQLVDRRKRAAPSPARPVTR